MSKSFAGIEKEWQQAVSLIEGEKLILFPCTIISEERVVYWPVGNGLGPFLKLAQKLGVQIVYAATREFGEEDIDELVSIAYGDTKPTKPAIEAANSELGIDFSYPEINKYTDYAKSFLERPQLFRVEWVHSGVIHTYWLIADWYSELIDRAGELQIQIAQHTEQLTNQREERIQDLARSLARDPAFQQARNWAAQTEVARKAYPNLTESMVRSLANQAHEIYEAKIAPEQERAQVNKARKLLESGMSRTKVAAQLGMTTGRLERMIARHANE